MEARALRAERELNSLRASFREFAVQSRSNTSALLLGLGKLVQEREAWRAQGRYERAAARVEIAQEHAAANAERARAPALVETE
mmetsp:Transcript_4224/g.9161  ORF Transcript_4224/g.9161 Transcript_4224/m.9161 type:complete len:84 (+) Transcript_4224:301-552(+)